MNVGKLFQVKEFYWLLFPSKDIAAAAAALFGPTPQITGGWPSGSSTTASNAAYWSKKYNCNVSYISPKSIFCFLEQDEKVIKILTTNGEVGWIHLSDFLIEDIEEVTV